MKNDTAHPPFLQEAIHAVTRPECCFFLSAVFIEQWMPRLGSIETKIILFLKTRQERTPVSVRGLAAGVGCDPATIRRVLLNPLLQQFLDRRAGCSPEQAKALLCAKAPSRFSESDKPYLGAWNHCAWCKGETLVLHSHHYPIPKAEGGTKTEEICATCHADYHALRTDQYILCLNSFAQQFFLLAARRKAVPRSTPCAARKKALVRLHRAFASHMNFLALPVIHFSTEFLEGDYGLGIGHSLGKNIPMPMFRQFYELRNSVLRIGHRYGTVGCAGDYQWDAEQEGPYLAEAEIIGDDSPDFFVVDELWNPVDKYVRVEPERSDLITLELLSSLAEALSDYPEWAIGVYLEDGCVLIFPEKLMVKGSRFGTCFDVVSVASACTS